MVIAGDTNKSLKGGHSAPDPLCGNAITNTVFPLLNAKKRLPFRARRRAVSTLDNVEISTAGVVRKGRGGGCLKLFVDTKGNIALPSIFSPYAGKFHKNNDCFGRVLS